MVKKSEIVFTFPDCIGGVASFNRNIINYASNKSNYSVHVILTKSKEDKRPIFNDPILADRVSRFTYSNKENQFHVCRRFSKLIGDKPGCIVTDNDLTLRTAALFNKSKAIFLLVHDFFYVNYALQYEPIINAAIAHSSFFKDILCAALPASYVNKSFYIPYGVQQTDREIKQNSSCVNLVFLGRLVEEKGIFELKKINDQLLAKGSIVNWTIIGSGPFESDLKEQWSGINNVSFLQPQTTEEVYKILKAQDILVLPTVFEGTPVSILECLSNGVVPVVSDLPGGIRDIVHAEVGYRCQVNDPGSFAEAMTKLINDRDRLFQLQSNCIEFARKNYDINRAADAYFDLFSRYGEYMSLKNTFSPNLSRLDKSFLPNKLVYFMRNLSQLIK